MSDDDQYYEDDYEDMDYEEGICGQADDLAEHTMPSPVWFDDDDLTFNVGDALDDWLLYESDDYFDQQPSRKRKPEAGSAGEQAVTPVLGAGNDEPTNMPAKRRRFSTAERIPKPCVPNSFSDSPIVDWRTQRHEPLSYPVFEEGTGIQVAILKDWRTKKEDKKHRTTSGTKLQSGKRAFAVVIERRRSEDLDKKVVLPATNERKMSFAEEVQAKPRVNAMTTTEPSRAKNQTKHETAMNPPQRPNLAQKGNSVTTTTRKRKATELDDEEDELQADYGELVQPKKRAGNESKRATPAQSNGTITLPKGQKRKAPEPEPELETSARPAKRQMARPIHPTVSHAERVTKGRGKFTTRRSTRKNN